MTKYYEYKYKKNEQQYIAFVEFTAIDSDEVKQKVFNKLSMLISDPIKESDIERCEHVTSVRLSKPINRIIVTGQSGNLVLNPKRTILTSI